MATRGGKSQGLGAPGGSAGGMGSLGTAGGGTSAPSPAPEAWLSSASGRVRGCVILLDSDSIGGDGAHGRALMRAFLYTLTEIAPQPETIILVGEAVRLARPGSESFECLSLLQEQRVEILRAEQSVRELGEEAAAAAGRAVTMHVIVDRLLRAEKVIAL